MRSLRTITAGTSSRKESLLLGLAWVQGEADVWWREAVPSLPSEELHQDLVHLHAMAATIEPLKQWISTLTWRPILPSISHIRHPLLLATLLDMDLIPTMAEMEVLAEAHNDSVEFANAVASASVRCARKPEMDWTRVLARFVFRGSVALTSEQSTFMGTAFRVLFTESVFPISRRPIAALACAALAYDPYLSPGDVEAWTECVRRNAGELYSFYVALMRNDENIARNKWCKLTLDSVGRR